MLARQLCLLPLLAIVHAAGAKPNDCPNFMDRATGNQKCVAKDLLIGWLSVLNKTSVRILEVRKNASEIKKGAEDVKSTAQTLLAKAKDALSKLEENSGEAQAFKKVVDDINSAVVQADESVHKATGAEVQADNATTNVRYGYGAISRVAWYSSKSGYLNEKLTYEVAKETVEKIKIEPRKCHNVNNVSKTLSDYAEKLNDDTTNLTDWKMGMLKMIQTTYNTTQNNKITCLRIFTANPDRVNQVMDTVKSMSGTLIVVMKNIDEALLTMKNAEANITAANQSMDSMATTMLNSLKQNGTALCDMLQRHEAVWSKLNKTKQTLKDVSQRAGNASASADKTKSAITASAKLVHGASKAVKTLSQPGGLFAQNGLAISNDVAAAMENMKKAGEASEQAVQSSGEVSLVVRSTEREMSTGYKKLEELGNNLRQRLREINITTSSVSASECSNKLTELLDGTHTEALRFATKLNVGELLKANETLRGLEAQAEKISNNATSINGKLEVAARNLKEATELDRSAAAAAEAAVAEALKHLMGRTCTIANKLRVLQNNLTLLNTDARSMKKSVSEEEAQAIAALKDADGSSDMSPHVEEGFALAVRMTALLDRELERSSAQIEKVTASHAAWKLKEVRSDNANVFDAVRDAVVGIFAGTHEKPSEDVCTASATAELVKKLRTGTDGQSLLRNTSAVTELSHFAAKMNAELASAARRVSTATVRAAEANKALAEAVRRAHEEAAGRRCPPLYRQLLNALSGRW